MKPTEDVGLWFELSYAQYLTIPRLALEAMPAEWQQRFYDLFSEFDDAINWRPEEGRYYCYLRDGKGRFVDDPLRHYRHPDPDLVKAIRRPGPGEPTGEEGK